MFVANNGWPPPRSTWLLRHGANDFRLKFYLYGSLVQIHTQTAPGHSAPVAPSAYIVGKIAVGCSRSLCVLQAHLYPAPCQEGPRRSSLQAGYPRRGGRQSDRVVSAPLESKLVERDSDFPRKGARQRVMVHAVLGEKRSGIEIYSGSFLRDNISGRQQDKSGARRDL